MATAQCNKDDLRIKPLRFDNDSSDLSVDEILENNLNFESSSRVLLEGNALTSVIVDYLHGILPDHDTNLPDMKVKIGALLQNLIQVSENNILVLSKIEGVDTLGGVSSTRKKNAHDKRFKIWHEICCLRRIIARIVKALNGKLHKTALLNEQVDVPHDTVRKLCDIRAKLNTIVIQKGKEIAYSQKTGDTVNWYHIAVMYEAAMILRAQGHIAGALDLSNIGKGLELNESGYMPDDSSTIEGLISFNPQLFSHGELKTSSKEKLTPKKMLFGISSALSKNSKWAAAQGLWQHSSKDLDSLIQVFEILITAVIGSKKNLGLSSILHVESTLRVICHNLIAAVRDDDEDLGGTWAAKHILSEKIVKMYKVLESTIDESLENNKWLRGMVRAKVLQDGGILLSNIVPASLVDEEYRTDPGKEEPQATATRLEREEETTAKLDVMKYLKLGWEDEFDCPARVRAGFRRSIVEDLKTRVNNLESSRVTTPRLERLVGDSTAPYPFKRGFSSWIWGTNKNETDSRHLRHFPQSNINKAQISITMGYMQCLLSQPEAGGMFSRLDEMIEFTKGQNKKHPQWRVTSTIRSRPQFTFGHLISPHNKKTLQEDNEKLIRSNLTRVNRMDPMMFAATALNLIEELISEEVTIENAEKRLDRAARQCEILVNSELGDEGFHIHDLIHAAKETSQAPMRLIDNAKTSGTSENEHDKSRMIEQILRVSFARLYLLSIRSEQLARVLIERPLRQPYQSSSILILDQIRVLLKYLHTDWIRSEEDFDDKCDINHDFVSDRLIVDKLNGLRKKKGHFGVAFAVKNYKDRYIDDKNPVYSDVAVEYHLANGLPRRSEHSSLTIRYCMEQTHQKLDFTKTLGPTWHKLLLQSMKNKYEGTADINSEETKELQHSIDEDSKELNTEPPSNDQKVIEAYEKLREKTDREWILWGRLAFFPAAFDGRIIVSSTTFAEINEIQTIEPRSLLWGELKKAYEKELNDTKAAKKND